MSRKIGSKKEIEWMNLVSRGRHPFLTIEAAWRGLFYYKELLNVGFNLKYYKYFEGMTFVARHEWKRLVKKFDDKFKTSYLNLYYPLKDCQKRNQELLKFVKDIQQQNLSQKNLKELQNLVKRFFDQYNRATLHFYVVWFIEEVLEKNIKKELLNRLKKLGQGDKLEVYYTAVSTIPRETRIMKERRELLKIVLKIKNNKNLKKLFLTKSKKEILKQIKNKKIHQDIKQHQKKYIWLPTFLFKVMELTIEQILDNIKESLLKKTGRELKNIQKQKAKDRVFFNQVVKKLSLKGKILKYIWLLREWVYYRQERMAEWAEINYHAKILFDEIARRWNLDYESILNLSVDEIISGKFNYRDIKTRQKGYAVEVINGKIKYYTDRQLKNYVRKEKGKLKQKEVKELKGEPANPGKATGKVRICNTYTFQNLKQGEILVTGTTTPETVTYIKKAAAIIANEGGVLSHAAIVSRELNIPCIIGTKIATKVLKDGDLVEVDANRGVVMILKR